MNTNIWKENLKKITTGRPRGIWDNDIQMYLE
jgi:hypothetical protein